MIASAVAAFARANHLCTFPPIDAMVSAICAIFWQSAAPCSNGRFSPLILCDKARFLHAPASFSQRGEHIIVSGHTHEPLILFFRGRIMGVLPSRSSFGLRGSIAPADPRENRFHYRAYRVSHKIA
jgi:hypothetical protein